MLSDETLKNYQRAGRIASEVRNMARTLIKPGKPIVEICEIIERSIKKKGGTPAFPCNICVNEVAAHYSSPPDDDRKIPKDAVVKIDLGVHVNGYIADTATTVSMKSEYSGMVSAIEKALESVLKNIRPNVKTKELGRQVQNTIERYGFKPIWNLSGHQMGRFLLHTGKSIPNVPKFGFSKIEEGEVFAVEPFLTLPSGSGEVYSSDESYIYRYHKSKSTRNPNTKRLLTMIKKEFRSLPFTQRWLKDFMHAKELNEAFIELLSNKSVSAYPVLVEKNHKPVAQAEHTIIVTDSGCLVTTL